MPAAAPSKPQIHTAHVPYEESASVKVPSEQEMPGVSLQRRELVARLKSMPDAQKSDFVKTPWPGQHPPGLYKVLGVDHNFRIALNKAGLIEPVQSQKGPSKRGQSPIKSIVRVYPNGDAPQAAGRRTSPKAGNKRKVSFDTLERFVKAVSEARTEILAAESAAMDKRIEDTKDELIDAGNIEDVGRLSDALQTALQSRRDVLTRATAIAVLNTIVEPDFRGLDKIVST